MTGPLSPSDPYALLDPDILSGALRTRWLGRRMQAFDAIGSTNDHALRLSSSAAAHGLAVLAERQTAGRGRLGRRWEAPRGRALLVSFVVRGLKYVGVERHLTPAAAVSMHRTFTRLGAGPCEIRWPNDVYLGGRKACGILTERGPWDDRPGWVVGIGVNVNQAPEDFPPELRDKASSMAMQSGRLYDRHAVFAELAGALEETFESIAGPADAREALRLAWERACGTLGRRVTIDTGAGLVEGMAVGLEASGALLVRRDDGRIEPVMAGTAVK